ncbi:hypothetical protein KFZ56_00315 [Virgibacillus sp. NKC19-3]|uniref:hypothetical protein n=1 Tax=Virgibacillus saliphilus TaxID=2831674 RepID=UPI001C9B98F1|nr:hypothetical protein [Virgibacillus sp. NKC19-3]MBY7141572.1 hypothetical protein [Virgibacillus sp. NKC19-3]
MADKYLKSLGFVREGRHWYHDKLMISVEIPNDMLEDADNERVVVLVLQNGLHVYVIGLEDIMLNRLRACVHWNSSSDCKWGRRLSLLHFERLDLNYLKDVAQRSNHPYSEPMVK